MDLGLVGAVLLGTLYYKYLRGFKRLGAEESMPPLMRAYFAGAGATFVAVLVMGLTNLNYMPGPQYTFVWFSFGALFAYWPLAMSRDTASEGDEKMRLYASRGRARMIRHFGR